MVLRNPEQDNFFYWLDFFPSFGLDVPPSGSYVLFMIAVEDMVRLSLLWWIMIPIGYRFTFGSVENYLPHVLAQVHKGSL